MFFAEILRTSVAEESYYFRLNVFVILFELEIPVVWNHDKRSIDR